MDPRPKAEDDIGGSSGLWSSFIPAQAGIQINFNKWHVDWVPTFVGMTVLGQMPSTMVMSMVPAPWRKILAAVYSGEVA